MRTPALLLAASATLATALVVGTSDVVKDLRVRDRPEHAHRPRRSSAAEPDLVRSPEGRRHRHDAGREGRHGHGRDADRSQGREDHDSVEHWAGACPPPDEPRPEPPPAAHAPNSGFVAFAVVGRQTRLYMPAPRAADGREPIAVLDASAATSTVGLLRLVDLGVGIEPSAVGADGKDVVVVDGGSPLVFFLDATTDTVKGTAPLPEGAVRFLVSGTQLFGSGVAVDAARRRAWVSYSGGIAEYDLDARLLTNAYEAPPSENFAYDAAGRFLYLPYYLCDPGGQSGGCDPYAQPGGPALTDGLTLVDLARGKTFSLTAPTLVDTHAPLGFEVDGVAIDPVLGLAAVVAEGPPALQVLATSPQCDEVALTCGLPLRLTVELPPDRFSAVTADPATHLAVVAQEGAAGIAFVDLALAKQGTRRSLLFSIPDPPDGEAWVTRVDPHGVTVGVVNGRPYAFVVHGSRTWVARIDLRKVSELATADQAAFAAAVSHFHVPPTPPY
jgi:hypothetical protein